MCRHSVTWVFQSAFLLLNITESYCICRLLWGRKTSVSLFLCCFWDYNGNIHAFPFSKVSSVMLLLLGLAFFSGLKSNSNFKYIPILKRDCKNGIKGSFFLLTKAVPVLAADIKQSKCLYLEEIMGIFKKQPLSWSHSRETCYFCQFTQICIFIAVFRTDIDALPWKLWFLCPCLITHIGTGCRSQARTC